MQNRHPSITALGEFSAVNLLCFGSAVCDHVSELKGNRVGCWTRQKGLLDRFVGQRKVFWTWDACWTRDASAIVAGGRGWSGLRTQWTNFEDGREFGAPVGFRASLACVLGWSETPCSGSERFPPRFLARGLRVPFFLREIGKGDFFVRTQWVPPV